MVNDPSAENEASETPGSSSAPVDSRGRLRYLLTPSKSATFDRIGSVALIDFSVEGARIRHAQPLTVGDAGVLSADLGIREISNRAFVIWSQRLEGSDPGGSQWASGLRFEEEMGDNAVLHELAEQGSARPIQELRAVDRYELTPSVEGRFAALGTVLVRDISERGVRIEHSASVRPGSRGTFRLSMSGADLEVVAQCVVGWSHIVRGSSAGISYLVGLSFLEVSNEIQDALPRLVKLGLAAVNLESLFVRRNLLKSQAHILLSQNARVVPAARSRADPAQVMLVDHARRHLREHPDQVDVLSQRARSITIDPLILESLPSDPGMRDELLAIWQYLERTLDLRVISKIVVGDSR